MEENYENSVSESMCVVPAYSRIKQNTIEETYKYFHKYIQNIKITDMKEWLQPRTELSAFDESLWLYLIDSLQFKNEVSEILLSQNQRQIKRVLQCNWYFQKLSAETCTKEIFPYVSFSLRCKIINKLSRHLESSEEAEKYFQFIRANYDSARAECILPRCSPEFILDYVKSSKCTFNHNTGIRILWNICRRYPETGVCIISNIFDMEKGDLLFYFFEKYAKLIRFLTAYHEDLMIPLLKKYIPLITWRAFGRKLTKKLGSKLGEDLILENCIEDCNQRTSAKQIVTFNIFKEQTLFSILSFDTKAKYMATIVRSKCENLSSVSWQSADERLASLLKLVPQDKRQALIDKAFRQVYDLNFNEYPKCWSPQVLETLPTETRVPYIAKLEELAEAGNTVFRKNAGYYRFSPDRPELFLYLYDSKLTFEKYKEILRKTPAISKREVIVYHLVKSCWISKDIKVLEDAVEFVSTHHRNDATVIFRFMEGICEHFRYTELSSTIFEKLDGLAYFCYMKGLKNDYIYCQFMEKHIYHLLDNNLNVDALVKRLFDLSHNSCRSTYVRDFRAKNSKRLSLLMCKEAVHWFRNKPEDEPGNLGIMYLMQTCQEYNKLNRSKILLRDIPGLEEVLSNRLKKTYGKIGWEEWPLAIWDKYYDVTDGAYHKPRVLLHVLKRKPHLIEKHLEGILQILFSEYFREYNAFFGYLIKRVSFLGKTEKMKEIILYEFENGKTTNERKNALTLYSYMCTIDEFTKVIESYLPKQETLELGPEDSFHEIQMLVPKMIKNIKPRWKNLELVSKFFFGDFLKSVLSSFYACCFNTRCDVIIPFLKKRLEELTPRVSYVKDTIRLILMLSDQKGRTEFCLEFWDKHKHYSVRSTVLHFFSQLFLEQRTQESFRVLEKFILDSDELTIAAVPELRKIPDEFLSDYVNALWRFSDIQKPNFRANYQRNLLERFYEKNPSEGRSNIQLLSPEFCEYIIKNYLFNQLSEISVDEFAALYLVANPEAVENRAFMLLDLIKERKPDTRLVYSFFKVLIRNSAEKPSDFTDLFRVILENWPEFPPGVLYEERVLFMYHNLYQNVLKRCGDNDTIAVEFGKELKKFYSSVENLNDLIPIYVESLKHFFTESYRTYKAILSLKELVTGTQNRSIAVVAILSLPEEAVVWYRRQRAISQEIANSKKELSEFIKILESYGDNVVEIYLRSKFEFVKK